MTKKKKILVDYTATWGREFIVDEDTTQDKIDKLIEDDWGDMMFSIVEGSCDWDIKSDYNEEMNDDLRKKGHLEITKDDEDVYGYEEEEKIDD